MPIVTKIVRIAMVKDVPTGKKKLIGRITKNAKT